MTFYTDATVIKLNNYNLLIVFEFQLGLIALKQTILLSTQLFTVLKGYVQNILSTKVLRRRKGNVFHCTCNIESACCKAVQPQRRKNFRHALFAAKSTSPTTTTTTTTTCLELLQFIVHSFGHILHVSSTHKVSYITAHFKT
jgi:hypothetical protein